MRYLALSPDLFEKTVDHKIIFQRETDFPRESTPDHRVFDDRITSSSAMLIDAVNCSLEARSTSQMASAGEANDL
jgi:hypothetical protein